MAGTLFLIAERNAVGCKVPRPHASAQHDMLCACSRSGHVELDTYGELFVTPPTGKHAQVRWIALLAIPIPSNSPLKLHSNNCLLPHCQFVAVAALCAPLPWSARWRWVTPGSNTMTVVKRETYMAFPHPSLDPSLSLHALFPISPDPAFCLLPIYLACI